MIIGVDIDNVLSNFNEVLLEKFKEHDKELRNTGIIDPNAGYITRGMFDWTNEEINEFYNNTVEEMIKHLNVLDGAPEYISKLRKLGNKIYIITGRNNGEYTDPINITTKWLDERNIEYDKLIFTNSSDHHAKTVVCLEESVNVMIEDSTHNCRDCEEYGIHTLLMENVYNEDDVQLQHVKNWKEIYEYIIGCK